MSPKLNRMSVMDMRLPAGIYHLVKEAQCGRHYEVSYGKSLCVELRHFALHEWDR